MKEPREFMLREPYSDGLTTAIIKDRKDILSGYTIHVREVFDEPVEPKWNPEYEYRIKPEPKYRPWTAEEVPVGALLHRLFEPNKITVILGTTSDKVILSGPAPAGSLFINDLFTYHGGHNGDRVEHSLDHGKTWLPCGVLISE